MLALSEEDKRFYFSHDVLEAVDRFRDVRSYVMRAYVYGVAGRTCFTHSAFYRIRLVRVKVMSHAEEHYHILGLGLG